MKRHLITGGAGFIGSHLADHLIRSGDDVCIIDNLSTGRFSNIAHLESSGHLRCIIDDVRDSKIIDDLVRDADYVYHLAASVGVRLVIERPTEALINNIVGTEVILRTACRYRKPILIASTSEVYGKSRNGKFQEDDDGVMGPTCKSRWGYATSKAIDEFLALAYAEEKQLPVVILRLFNTVGPRQTGRYGMVIPSLIRQALLQDKLTVFGDGEQSRCFAHVCDVVPVMAALVRLPQAYGRVFNVGTQEEVTINALAQRIIDLTCSESGIQHIPYSIAYPRGFEDMERRVPDLTRLQQLIGYEPQHTLDDTLRDVIADLRTELSINEGCLQAV